MTINQTDSTPWLCNSSKNWLPIRNNATDHQKVKQLPPYGKKLVDNLLVNGPQTNDVRIIIGSGAWNYSRDSSYPWLLLLPINKPPEYYRWPVASCECLVMEFGYTQPGIIERLARVLLHSKAVVARVLPHKQSMVVYRK